MGVKDRKSQSIDRQMGFIDSRIKPHLSFNKNSMPGFTNFEQFYFVIF